MTASKFTPRPWCLGPYDQYMGHFYIDPLDRKTPPVAVAFMVDTLRTEAECKANACLIAAAPELYRALKEALESIIWMSGSSDFSPTGEAHRGWEKLQVQMESMTNVLAKARGETP